jgi:hypothetical protein
MRRFVIAGTGRSGTKWCATALRNAGIYCGHEQVFTTAMLPEHYSPQWGGLEGDSSLAATPYMNELHDVRKVLVVRHPFAVVESWMFNGGFLGRRGIPLPAGLNQYLRSTFPEVLDSQNDIEAGCRYWLAVNRLGGIGAHTVLRLEDITKIGGAKKLLAAVGREPVWSTFEVGKVNGSPPEAHYGFDLTAVPLGLLEDVQELAISFGYQPGELS